MGRDPLTPVASTQTPPSLLLYTVHIRPIRLHQTGASFFLPPREREGHRLIPSPPLPPFPLSSPSPFSLTQSQLQFPFARANLGQEMPISSLIPSSSSVRGRLSSYFLLFCAKVFPSSVHLFLWGARGRRGRAFYPLEEPITTSRLSLFPPCFFYVRQEVGAEIVPSFPVAVRWRTNFFVVSSSSFSSSSS